MAAADALARAGADVRCFEAARPGSGQSAGLTRIFRHLHEDPALCALAVASRAGWREWEARAGRRLVGDEGAVTATPDATEALVRLGTAGAAAGLLQAEQALPILRAGAGPAVLEPEGGAIRARRTIQALEGWLGPRVVLEEVLGLRLRGGAVEVSTSEGLWRCDRVLVCAGARTSALAAAQGFDVPLDVRLHVRATFAIKERFARRLLPAWIDAAGAFGERVYASPVGSSGHYAVGLVDAEADAPVAGDAIAAGGDLAPAVARLRRYVDRALPGLDPDPVGLRLCRTTRLPWSRDAFAAWCDGPVTLFAGSNLFKHAPSLGRLLAQAVATGEPPALLTPPPR
jgi:sarcosine oxidase